MNRFAALIFLTVTAATVPPCAAGWPLGMDHKPGYDDSGIWMRRNQIVLQDATAVIVVAGALWEGSEWRLGHASWQSLDSVLLGTGASSRIEAAFQPPTTSPDRRPDSIVSRPRT